MKILILALAATGLLAACAPAPVDGNTSSPPGNSDGSVLVPPTEPAGQCRADQYQHYVGRNRSELPPKPANENWRVTCTTCPVTMDYSPSRLNIFYEQGSGIIREVKCG